MDAMMILSAALAALNVKEIVSLANAMDSACGDGTASAFGGALAGAAALKVAEVAEDSSANSSPYDPAWGMVLTFPSDINKIRLIKALRILTGHGLKASKITVDTFFEGMFGTESPCDAERQDHRYAQFCIHCDLDLTFPTAYSRCMVLQGEFKNYGADARVAPVAELRNCLPMGGVALLSNLIDMDYYHSGYSG